MDQNSVDIPSDAGAVSSGSSIQDKLEKHMGQDTEIQPPMAESPQPKLSSAKSILVLSSILIAMFLVALDRTIIATVLSLSTLQPSTQTNTIPGHPSNLQLILLSLLRRLVRLLLPPHNLRAAAPLWKALHPFPYQAHSAY